MAVVVVGAGLAGLMAARTLVDRGHEVTVVDKGRSPGGRMATRRLDEDGAALADHGAQFFTVRSPEFAAVVQTWPVEVWHHGPATAPDIADGPSSVKPAGDGHPRYRGAVSMNDITRHLAEGLDVRTRTRISRVAPDGDGWILDAPDGPMSADAVILTSPIPQTAEIISLGLPEEVTRIEYAPTVGLLAVLQGPAGLPDPGAVQLDGGTVHYLADNQAKGIASRPTVTVHATTAWSQAHYDDADGDIEAALSAAIRPWLSSAISQTQVKRWRYAQPTTVHPDRAVQVAPGLILAGDAFGGPKVEGATLSGMAAGGLLDAALTGPDAP